MLRSTIQCVALRHAVRRNNAAATSAKKRALAKSQLAGSSGGGGGGEPKSSPPPPSATAASSETSSMITVAIVGLAAAGGAAWYLDLLPRVNQPEVEGEVVVVESVEESVPAPTEKQPVAKGEAKKESATASVASKEPDDTLTAKPDAATSRVSAIQVPTQSRPPAKIPPPPSHPVQGNRVAISPPLPSKEASASEAAKELESASLEETSATLARAHQMLRADLDQSLFQDLHSLSSEQLKIRVVQLATELEERTKWEAVRLKEFLAMKEKETSEK